MTRNDLNNDYFDWLSDLVCRQRYSERISYKKLLMFLHSTEFRYSIPIDENRAYDGENLRWLYVCDRGYKDRCDEVLDDLSGPCSVLEMIIALSIRCEESIMDDPSKGDRTGQWFWEMIVNLGLGSMYDSRFDKQYVEDVVTRFLDRDYDPDGKGGLFTIRNCERDVRTMEIWHQLTYFLDTIV